MALFSFIKRTLVSDLHTQGKRCGISLRATVDNTDSLSEMALCRSIVVCDEA